MTAGRGAVARSPAGPIPFEEVIALALYDPNTGFYATGGRRAGRGDFLTSPEVGPLFGAVVARPWTSGGPTCGSQRSSRWSRPVRGPGTLARTVLAASPTLQPCPSLRAGRGGRATGGACRAPRAAAAPAFAFASLPDPDEDEAPAVVPSGPIVVSLTALPPRPRAVRRPRQRAARQPPLRPDRAG